MGKMQNELKTDVQAFIAASVCRLIDLGVTHVTMDYVGSGDSGDAISIRQFDVAGIELNAPFREAEQLGLTLLCLYVNGWELDGGSQGRLNLKLLTGELRIEHYADIAHSDFSSRTFHASEIEGVSDTIKQLRPLIGQDAAIGPCGRVSEVIALYSGSYDEVTSFVAYYPSTNADPTDITYPNAAVMGAIEDVAQKLLARFHADWQKDAGADGVITVNIGSLMITLCHTAFQRNVERLEVVDQLCFASLL